MWTPSLKYLHVQNKQYGGRIAPAEVWKHGYTMIDIQSSGIIGARDFQVKKAKVPKLNRNISRIHFGMLISLSVHKW